jgi:hypothetical protein
MSVSARAALKKMPLLYHIPFVWGIAVSWTADGIAKDSTDNGQDAAF